MRKKLMVILLAITALLSACQKTPTITVSNDTTAEILSREPESLIDEDKLTIVTMLDEDVNEIFFLFDVTVTLNGIISKPNIMDGLYTYTAEVADYSMYEQNMAFLFGDYEYLLDMNSEYKMVVSEDGYKAYILNTNLYEERGFVGPWGQIGFYKMDRPVTEDMKKVNLTNEEAILQAQDILVQIGLTGYEYDRCEYYEEVLQITPEGTLSAPMGDQLLVYYLQNIQGVPIRSEIFECRMDPMGRVIFEAEGVYEVIVSEYEYKLYGEIKNCISYDEMMDIFLNYMKRNIKFDGAVFDKVLFEYTIKNEYIDGKNVSLAIPCWHLYCKRVSDCSLGSMTSVDIIIDCVNGTVYEQTDVQ